MYKLGRTHVIANALLRLLDITKPKVVLDQTTDANLFYAKPEWMKGVKEFLRIIQIKGTLLIQQKQRLVERAKPFTLKNGEL